LPPGALGRPQLALTQFDTLAFGQIDQLLDRAVGEPGVGRMRDRFLLYGGVRRNPLEIFGLYRPASVRRREALLQQRGESSRGWLIVPATAAPSAERKVRSRIPKGVITLIV
jgi:hypothetical protein